MIQREQPGSEFAGLMCAPQLERGRCVQIGNGLRVEQGGLPMVNTRGLNGPSESAARRALLLAGALALRGLLMLVLGGFVLMTRIAHRRSEV